MHGLITTGHVKLASLDVHCNKFNTSSENIFVEAKKKKKSEVNWNTIIYIHKLESIIINDYKCIKCEPVTVNEKKIHDWIVKLSAAYDHCLRVSSD